jgi:hypothetical protein
MNLFGDDPSEESAAITKWRTTNASQRRNSLSARCRTAMPAANHRGHSFTDDDAEEPVFDVLVCGSLPQ